MVVSWQSLAIMLLTASVRERPLSPIPAKVEQLTIAEGEYKQFKILPDFRTLHLVHANGTIYVFRLSGVKGLTEE